jgi:hypothetical protein
VKLLLLAVVAGASWAAGRRQGREDLTVAVRRALFGRKS